MDKLNRQDVFNRVYLYYAEGGTPGYDPGIGQCAYFGVDGGRCAMGVVLDSLGFARKDLGDDAQMGDVSDVINDLGTKLTDNFEKNVHVDDKDTISGRSFLSRLQGTHDGSVEANFDEEDGWDENTRDDLVTAFMIFAKEEGLTVPSE